MPTFNPKNIVKRFAFVMPFKYTDNRAVPYNEIVPSYNRQADAFVVFYWDNGMQIWVRDEFDGVWTSEESARIRADGLHAQIERKLTKKGRVNVDRAEHHV